MIIQLTFEQRGFELLGSTYLWIFPIYVQSALRIPGVRTHRFNQPRIKNSILIRGWESANVEGRLYALFCAALYKGLEHPKILVSMGALAPAPHRYQGRAEVLEKSKVICGFSIV